MKRLLTLYTIIAFGMIARANAGALEEQKVQILLKEATSSILTFNASDYEAKKELNRQYFSAHGYESFYKALDMAGYKGAMERNGTTLETSMTCPATIKESITTEKKWFKETSFPVWQAEFPMKMVWNSAQGAETNYMKIFARVIIPDTKSPDHFAIEQWVAMRGDEASANTCGQ